MKVFVDECVDWRISRDIVGHEVKTAHQMGWATIKNGELLALAISCRVEQAGFVNRGGSTTALRLIRRLELRAVTFSRKYLSYRQSARFS